ARTGPSDLSRDCNAESMNVRFRRTLADDLDFVLSAERSQENRPFITVWELDQHLAALTSEDLSPLIIESIAEGHRVGYIILAGLADTNTSIEFCRILRTEKSKS